MSKRRQGVIFPVVVIGTIGLAALLTIAIWYFPPGARILVRENVVQKAAAETEIRREGREFDLKLFQRELAALRGDQEALVLHRYGDAAPWARSIRAAYFVSTPCYAYLRWRAGDRLRSYFQEKPGRQFVTVEDLKITPFDLEELWRGAGLVAAEKLIQALPTPRAAQRCDLEGAVEVSEAIIDILTKLGLKPEDFGTTPEKLAALVKAAR